MTGTPSRESLSIFTKLAFGAGDLGPAIVAAINGFFLNAFLLDVAGLRPALAGTIFLVVKIWDAINDPLLGMLSDRKKTRWGRRTARLRQFYYGCHLAGQLCGSAPLSHDSPEA
jgi:GPH family glycoside/pentoside/hexuronide:cation symporter